MNTMIEEINEIAKQNQEYAWHETEVLITGCGSLAKAITKILCEKYHPRGIRIFSHSEYPQVVAHNDFKKYDTPIAFLYGDIRDLERLKLAMENVNIVFHTAAMKHVSKCENDCLDAVETNINGTKNVALACIDKKVDVAMFISTDKSIYPVNLYGATKMVAEKMWIHSNIYTPHSTKFSACRYGNVLGSRGSVVEIFNKQKDSGEITITDFDMTRFWITLPEVAEFVIQSAENTKGAEIFIPKMQAMKVLDLAKEIGKDCTFKEIGIGEGEKLHECLITSEESVHAKILADKYIIDRDYYNPIPFSYGSNNPDILMSKETLREKLKEFI